MSPTHPVEAPTETVDLFEAEKKDLEVFINKNRVDEFGAEKEDFFHKNISEIVSSFVDFDSETGKAALHTEAAGIYWQAATARDMRRINKEGGHVAGDYYLSKTVELIKESQINHVRMEPRVFHLLGADFISSGRCPYPGDLIDIQQNLSEAKVAIREDSDEGRISSVIITLEDAVNFYNKFLETGAKTPTEIQTLSKREIEKMFIDQTIRFLKFNLEFQKLEDAVSDFEGMKWADTKARATYYEMYIGPQFKGSELDTYQKYLDTNPDYVKDISATLSYMRSFEDVSLNPKIVEYVNSQASKNANILQTVISNEEGNIKKIAHTPFERDMNDKLILKWAFEKDQQRFRTDNLKYFQKLSGLIDAISVDGIEDNDVDTLDKVNELAIILLKTDANPSKLQKIIETTEALKQGTTEDKAENADWLVSQRQGRIIAFMEFAEAKKQEYLLEYDRVTGLPNREAFKKHLDELIRKPNSDFSLVSVDLGFLKYFNDVGDRQTGDLAIQKAGWVLDKVSKLSSNDKQNITVYRVGGDEFQILIEGGDKDSRAQGIISTVEMFVYGKDSDDIENQIYENGMIPKSPTAKGDYEPTSILFDFGYADNEDAKKILRSILSDSSRTPFSESDIEVLNRALNGEELTEEELNLYVGKIGEITTRIADVAEEEYKIKHRFAYLVNRYKDIYDREGPPTVTSRSWNRYQDFITASKKTIGGKGIEDVRIAYSRLYAKGITRISDLNNEEFDSEARDFLGTFQTSEEEQVENIAKSFALKHQLDRKDKNRI